MTLHEEIEACFEKGRVDRERMNRYYYEKLAGELVLREVALKLKKLTNDMFSEHKHLPDVADYLEVLVNFYWKKEKK